MTRALRLAAAVLLLLALAGALPAAAQTFEDAAAAYKRDDYTTAFLGFRSLAEQGDADAQFILGLMYRIGEGVPEDDAEAARWIRRAAEQGDADAQFALGRMYRIGEGVLQDDAEAVRWYRRAAAQGNASAQFNLGFMYDNGKGVLQDDAEAVRWYRRAAAQGNASAQFNLALMYRHGEGVLQDDAEAVRWYRRAAAQGDADAQFNLGFMYDNGKGVPEDDAEAARWYRRAAEQGHASAQFNLGVMYDYGEGVPEDDSEAVRWYRRAAEQGHASAQFNLGVMYDYGEGVPEDDSEAVRWYRRAAEQGDASAQFRLGFMYDNGEGVPQDYAEAARWYRRAAEQGHAKAQVNLGFMYELGRGVRQDFVQAHIWFNLAASRSSASQKDLREFAVEGRESVAARLTAAALARAQRLAREWRPGTGAAVSTPPAAGAGDLRSRVAEVQRALARLGYAPGPADGALGPKTRAAIREFQAAAGLPADGRLSERLESAVIAALLAAGGAATDSSPAHRAPEREATGSGFRVSADGHVLTNAHVVRGCAEVRLPPAGPAAVAARDEAADLALLRGPAGAPFAAFRQGRGIRPGASVLVAGYPLRGLLASGANVSTGVVATLAGPGDDRRLIQITAPVQPGNSGGPVLDSAGNAVGVVVSKLDALGLARATGDIPQNVNFAVSAGTARAFLDAEGVAYATAPSDEARAPDDVAAAAKGFTVLVECWN